MFTLLIVCLPLLLSSLPALQAAVALLIQPLSVLNWVLYPHKWLNLLNTLTLHKNTEASHKSSLCRCEIVRVQERGNSWIAVLNISDWTEAFWFPIRTLNIYKVHKLMFEGYTKTDPSEINWKKNTVSDARRHCRSPGSGQWGVAKWTLCPEFTGLYSSWHQLVLRVCVSPSWPGSGWQVDKSLESRHSHGERGESRDLDSKLEVTAGSQLLL